MKKTLGLTGVTVNAMALIAPGAFLWITYQVQAAQTTPGGDSTAMDMWPGIVFALILAFLTAISYSELAKIYPEAGTGSAYYFAEKAFIDKEETRHHKWGRLAKLATGWAAHLFYWVYPGVMVAFMATLLSYIWQAFTGESLALPALIVIACLFSIFVGFIAYRGVSGSTTTSLLINVIQLTALAVFAVIAIIYRTANPEHANFVFSSPADVMLPHNMMNVLFQGTIAILILVGFESCTAFGAEAKNAKRDVPRAVILALVIQGLIAYLFEYFAANFGLSDKLTGTATVDGATKAVSGVDAAGASSAPIGDMIVQMVNGLSGGEGIGFALMIVIAVTVALAILGTTLSAMNTAVRITYAMAQDSEMPQPLGLLHLENATPHVAVWALVVISAIVGSIGCVSVVFLTGITLASNFGTFVLYALTCLWTIIAFAGRHERNSLLHMIIPILGLLANIVMLLTILGLGFIGGGDSQTESMMALIIAGIWLVASVVYVVARNAKTGRKLMEVPSVTS
ncbi:MAG TPA: APC family permease [Chloroflexota bacterium]|nr:APC family permease [Chloroflexota bacterium]